MDNDALESELREMRREFIKLRRQVDNLMYKFFGHYHLENGVTQRNFEREEEARKKIVEMTS